MITTWTSLITRCLSTIPYPRHICKHCRLPQTKVFLEVAVCRMGWADRWCWLLCGGWTLELISAICAVLFSIALPVDVDTQVICFAVEFSAGTTSWACWWWRGASLKKKKKDYCCEGHSARYSLIFLHGSAHYKWFLVRCCCFSLADATCRQGQNCHNFHSSESVL